MTTEADIGPPANKKSKTVNQPFEKSDFEQTNTTLDIIMAEANNDGSSENTKHMRPPKQWDLSALKSDKFEKYYKVKAFLSVSQKILCKKKTQSFSFFYIAQNRTKNKINKKTQGIVDESEWELFLQTLQTDLPSSFRINLGAPMAKKLLQKLQNDDFNLTEYVSIFFCFL